MNTVVRRIDDSGLKKRGSSRCPECAHQRALDMPEPSQRTALCIPCALTNHEFNQRIPTSASQTLDEEPTTPKAYIDGQRYRMLYFPFPDRPACTDCGEKAYIVYEPE